MGNGEDFKDPHVVLDGFASLRRHHAAKRKVREAQITALPLVPNARILDVGIGPGLYLEHWLELTEKSGARFTLVDNSEPALAECRRIAFAAGAKARVETMSLDLFALGRSGIGPFDLVFIGNTLEYVREPAAFLRQEIRPLVRPGGTIAVRDLDCGVLGTNLVDPALCAKVVTARILGCQLISREPGGVFHDPFVGRDLGRILSEAGLTEVRHLPYYCEFAAPLSEAERQYLAALHTTWYVEDRAGHLTAAEKAAWSQAFNADRVDGVLRAPGLFYVETEFLALGRHG